ncbi:MAG: futalosine hydrolase [Bacteroidales bacterium]|nr:futalosine hydrolase [Bacteroidales bacterium]
MIDTVLITAATVRETECMNKVNAGRFKNKAPLLISGIGPVSTVYAIMNYLAHNGKPDLLINIGIAGSYTGNLPVGTVVVPVSDMFADLGVCDGKNFIPLSRAGIKDDDDNYTPTGIFHADQEIVQKLAAYLSPVKAVTVSTATGSAEIREAIRSEHNPDIESMEGAAAYYVCNKQGIPCIGIRAISNMVGPRNKSLWDIDLALEQLEQALVNHFNAIIT